MKNLGSGLCVQEVSTRGSKDSDTFDKIFPFQTNISLQQSAQKKPFSEGLFDMFSLVFHLNTGFSFFLADGFNQC
jgi:hypothetical protein